MNCCSIYLLVALTNNVAWKLIEKTSHKIGWGCMFSSNCHKILAIFVNWMLAISTLAISRTRAALTKFSISVVHYLACNALVVSKKIDGWRCLKSKMALGYWSLVLQHHLRLPSHMLVKFHLLRLFIDYPIMHSNTSLATITVAVELELASFSLGWQAISLKTKVK